MNNITTTLGDITKITGFDAIVNAANNSLLGGGGVDGAIHHAAGPELLEECMTLNGCMTGEAKITGAYRLPCKYIIHTVGPVYRNREQSEPSLRAAYTSCLNLARQKGIRKIAFPSISTGIYRYPLEDAAKIAIETAKEYLRAYPDAFDEICWCLFDDRTKAAYDKALEK